MKEHNHLLLNEHNRYSLLFRESIKYVLQFSLKAVIYIIITLIPLWVKHSQQNNVILHRTTNELSCYNYIRHENASFYNLNNIPFLLKSEVK